MMQGWRGMEGFSPPLESAIRAVLKINVLVVRSNRLFLIRVPAGRWLATGTRPGTTAKSNY
jgi:hypothetical protein